MDRKHSTKKQSIKPILTSVSKLDSGDTHQSIGASFVKIDSKDCLLWPLEI